MGKINKRVSKAFGKKIYLLGVDKEGENVWLEEPSWDCDWYWGFGYIERYTNNENPERSRDILSHSHWDSEIVGKIDVWDEKKQKFVKSEYIHHLNENPNFKDTVLTDDESWELAELMNSFYILSKTAELLKYGCSGVADNLAKDTIKNVEFRDKINKIILPKIFKKIDKLLSK